MKVNHSLVTLYCRTVLTALVSGDLLLIRQEERGQGLRCEISTLCAVFVIISCSVIIGDLGRQVVLEGIWLVMFQ